MSFFFFNDTATTEIYTLSLHDALPICMCAPRAAAGAASSAGSAWRCPRSLPDRKSTRLNSSHGYISYAVFCLKKKKRDYHALHQSTFTPPDDRRMAHIVYRDSAAVTSL